MRANVVERLQRRSHAKARARGLRRLQRLDQLAADQQRDGRVRRHTHGAQQHGGIDLLLKVVVAHVHDTVFIHHYLAARFEVVLCVISKKKKKKKEAHARERRP